MADHDEKPNDIGKRLSDAWHSLAQRRSRHRWCIFVVSAILMSVVVTLLGLKFGSMNHNQPIRQQAPAGPVGGTLR